MDFIICWVLKVDIWYQSSLKYNNSCISKCSRVKVNRNIRHITPVSKTSVIYSSSCPCCLSSSSKWLRNVPFYIGNLLILYSIFRVVLSIFHSHINITPHSETSLFKCKTWFSHMLMTCWQSILWRSYIMGVLILSISNLLILYPGQRMSWMHSEVPLYPVLWTIHQVIRRCSFIRQTNQK